mmetsp:Transcript_16924/g.23210  ORF Transcript_16924/g.23210 Transcript_16924/m.23210 type:complete len:296 (-) Transcript_16924:101-988(-)
MSSMELPLLKDMVKERDEKIASLVKTRESQELQIEKYHAETEQVQMISEEQKKSYQSQIEQIKKSKQDCEEKIEELTREMQARNVADYVTAVKVNNSNPMYVLCAQAQLCMAMHKMGILENQLTMVKEGCQSFVKSVNEEISGQIDDKCKFEVELMSQLAILDGNSRTLEEKQNERLSNAENEEEELKKEAAEKGYNEASSEEDDTGDDVKQQIEALQKQIEMVTAEKRLMEEDLRAVVADRSNVISDLEKEASKQQNTIKEFQLQIQDKRRIIENRKRSAENSDINGHGATLVE